MSFSYNGLIYRDLEDQVRYDAEQVQLLKQADVTINESLQTINTEINGKLTKPANPSAESAVTMLADGTVGTKPLSEIGGSGGKLYRHAFSFKWNNNRKFFYYYFYNTRSTTYSDYEDIIAGGNYIGTYVDADTDSFGAAAIQTFGSSTIRIKGAVSSRSGVLNVSETISQFTFVDTVIEV